MNIENHIKAFYRGERINHISFAGFGASAVLVGFAYYYFKPGALSYGILYGLGMIGVFQILIGLVRFLRTFNQYQKANNSHQADKSYLKTSEMDRITNAIEKLKKMRTVETVIFIIAMLVFVIGWGVNADKFLLGNAAGLCMHAATMLVFDLFTQSRVQEYQHQVGKLVEGFKSEYIR